MVLHAITQMASNGWRALLWRAHIRWRPVFVYLIGCALALARMVDHALRAGQADRAAVARRHAVHGAADADGPEAQSGQRLAGRVLRLDLHGVDADDRRLRPADGHLLPRRQFRAPRGGRDQGDLPGREPFYKADLFRRHHRSGGFARSGARGDRGRGLDARHHAGAADPGSDERCAVSHLGEPADHHGRRAITSSMAAGCCSRAVRLRPIREGEARWRKRRIPWCSISSNGWRGSRGPMPRWSRPGAPPVRA